MIIIEKIVIKNFRSIKSISNDLKTNHLNIFVGNNDQGKSNILRALNLFFNAETDYGQAFRFEDDYCFLADSGKGARKEIKIELTIVAPKDRFKSYSRIKWTKKWKADGSVSDNRINLKTNSSISEASNVYKWLNKIRFRYVPAVKGDAYFSSLMGTLHDVLSVAHSTDFSKQGASFIKGIKKFTNQITDALDSRIGIKNSLQVPSDFRSLFSNLDFGIQNRNYTLHLKRRGDGVKIRHIPIILKYLAEEEKKLAIKGYIKPDTIWGFEEPENNLELKYAYEMAREFTEYAKDIQIFITTHSPAFYSLNEEELSLTFFVKQTQNKCTEVFVSDSANNENLHRELGILPLIEPYLTKIMKREKESDKLKKDIDKLGGNYEYFVLTEDRDIKYIKAYFKANGYMDTVTAYISFNGCGNSQYAVMLADYISSSNDKATIIIHIDRDYNRAAAISKLETKIKSNNRIKLFITPGVDIENEFLAPNHIHHLYPDIALNEIKKIVDDATKKAEETSLKKFANTFVNNMGHDNFDYALLQDAIDNDFIPNSVEYRLGKKVLGFVKSDLQRILRKNPELIKETEYLKNHDLIKMMQK